MKSLHRMTLTLHASLTAHGSVPTVGELKRMLAKVTRAEQSYRARKPRPRLTPSHRNTVIAAMRGYDGSFDAFLRASHLGKVKGIHQMDLIDRSNGYVIRCAALQTADERAMGQIPRDLGEKTVPVKTLEGWWTASRRGKS
jgi:hypothetical protein